MAQRRRCFQGVKFGASVTEHPEIGVRQAKKLKLVPLSSDCSPSPALARFASENYQSLSLIRLVAESSDLDVERFCNE